MMESEHNSSVEAPSSTTTPTPSTPTPSADEKVLKDLDTLVEQIDLCKSMLNPTDGAKVDIDSNEALLAVIGFLEACAPRMLELIEAAAQGALAEETMEKCLDVNDRLLKTLGDLDNGGGGPPDARAPKGGGGEAKMPEGEVDLDDLLLDEDGGKGYKTSTKLGAGRFASNDTTPVKGAGKTTGEEDPFSGKTDLLVPTPLGKPSAPPPAAAPPPPAASSGKGEDDFDAFLQERTGKSD